MKDYKFGLRLLFSLIASWCFAQVVNAEDHFRAYSNNMASITLPSGHAQRMPDQRERSKWIEETQQLLEELEELLERGISGSEEQKKGSTVTE